MNRLQLVLLPSMIALASLYDVVLLVHTQFSQLKSQTFNLSNQNSSGCPSVWFAATHNCRDLHLNCEGEIAYTDTRHILTYDFNKEVISAIKIRHKYLKGYNVTVTKDGSYRLLLPNNISELNQYMCDPLNRKDYLCSDCKSGYGPAIVSESASCANKCYSCKDTWYNVLLYLSLSFIPPTVFYLLILVFQVRLTSAPVTCFIMYSQLMVLAFYEECGLEPDDSVFSHIKFTDSGTTLRTGTKILLTLYGVFNLDFFQYVPPPFCISSQFMSSLLAIFLPFILFY